MKVIKSGFEKIPISIQFSQENTIQFLQENTPLEKSRRDYIHDITSIDYIFPHETIDTLLYEGKYKTEEGLILPLRKKIDLRVRTVRIASNPTDYMILDQDPGFIVAHIPYITDSPSLRDFLLQRRSKYIAQIIDHEGNVIIQNSALNTNSLVKNYA